MAKDKEETEAAAAATEPAALSPVVCDGCGEPPNNNNKSLKRCTRCRRAAYHNVECQRRHYPLHRADCRRWSKQQQQQQAPAEERRQQQPTAAETATATGSARTMVRVEEREKRGKCLVAVKDIGANQFIVPPPMTATKSGTLNEHQSAIHTTFAPMVPPVLFPEQRLTHCAVCFQRLVSSSNSNNKPIVLCDHPRFTVKVCSTACQTAGQNWLPVEIRAVAAALHKHFAQRPSVRILPSALLLYRIFLAVSVSSSSENDSNNNSNNTADFALNWHDHILSMQTHEPANVNAGDAATTHRQAALILVSTLLPETPGWSFARMRQLERCFPVASGGGSSGSSGGGIQTAVSQVLNRILCNCFTLTNSNDDSLADNESGGVGFGLYRAPAHRINHSCAPNAAQSFVFQRGALPRLQIRALRAIAAGTEVCISYIDQQLQASTAERRALLQQTYHFACDCPRCTVRIK